MSNVLAPDAAHGTPCDVIRQRAVYSEDVHQSRARRSCGGSIGNAEFSLGICADGPIDAAVLGCGGDVREDGDLMLSMGAVVGLCKLDVRDGVAFDIGGVGEYGVHGWLIQLVLAGRTFRDSDARIGTGAESAWVD